MTTYVDLYLRLSDGRDLSSLDARERVLRAEADRRGWTVHRVVIENDLALGKSRNASAFRRQMITLPDGTKGLRTVRPGFRSVLDDFARGYAHAAVAEDFDRFVRDHRDGEDLLDVAEIYKITVLGLSDDSLKLTNGGTDSERERVRDYIRHANKSSRDTGRRVRAARGRQAERGIWGGGTRPYGFTPIPHPDGKYQNTQLVVCEEEAYEIRKATEAVFSKIPLKAIARNMRARGVLTVTGVQWTAETLRDVLLRPLNAGIVVYDGEETATRLTNEPILDEQVWRSLVKILTDPSRSTLGQTPAGLSQSAPGRAPTWLGTGLYRCVCGSAMAIQGGRNRARAYRCGARTEDRVGDVHVRRDAMLLDRFVTRTVVERLSDRDQFALLVKAAKPEVDVDGLRMKAKVLRTRLDDLGAAFADGDIDKLQLAAGTKRLRSKLDAVNETLSRVTDVSRLTRLVAPFNPLAQLADTAGIWLKLSLGERRAIVSELMTVTVLPASAPRFREKDIRIEWRS